MKNTKNIIAKKTNNKSFNNEESKKEKFTNEKPNVWNLKDIFGDTDIDKHIADLKVEVEKFKKIRDILNNNITSEKLLEIIRFKEKIVVTMSKIGTYYNLKFSENTSDTKILGKLTMLKQLSSEISNAVMFFSLWFMKLDDNISNKLLNSKELKDYTHHLERIKDFKQYTKEEDIEKILTYKDVTGHDSFSNLYDIFTSSFRFDFEGKKNVTQEEIVSKYTGSDPILRKKAYDTVLGKYGESSVILSEIYKNIVMNWFNDGINIRGYKRPISIWNMYNDVDDYAVDTMLDVVRKNSKLFSEYFKLKYKLNKNNGQKYEFSRYHLYAPYNTTNRTYDYNSSVQKVLDTYKKFDERFYAKAAEVFSKNHVHSHPSPGKRSGAFCSGPSIDVTPYVLLNHTGRIRDLFTMMHELGHAIHFSFSAKQTDFQYDCALPMAETASIFGEMVLADRLLSESKSKEEKIGILTYLLDGQYASIHRQAYFVIFEKYAHDAIIKGATKEELDKEYLSLLKEQFGDMELPDIYKHEWNYIPHIYHTPFYCYAYSWGNLVVLSLYAMYRKEGKKFVDKYHTLLSLGGSRSPINSLKTIGIDATSMKFWEGGINIIKEEIEELKKLVK